jgi:hypothetical protein
MGRPTRRETFRRLSYTPRPIASDSDLVVLALVTAQALESTGEMREAAQWLRRAADQAMRDGDVERVHSLARAAASLTNAVAPSPGWARSVRPPRSSSMRTTSGRASSPRATIPPPQPISTPWSSSTPRPPSLRDARVFTESPSDTGQASPDGTIEAMILLMAAAG